MSGLRDASGTIVIDEAEAEEDIRRVNAARESLDEAKQFLNPATIDSDRCYGMTRDALEEQFTQITAKLTEWQNFCDETVSYIRHVVAEYKRIDRECAAKAKELK
ncbi:MAG: hypothetical protein IJG37_09510 [Synergistaceae bacterium]|nr:hypothetical protein [Synergistaceae bacterium]MBQ3653085.1 hypothetical protein [Synergistaceae bacterium]MBR0034565.1 hypothetical protein [Synergistaceae bacterium]